MPQYNRNANMEMDDSNAKKRKIKHTESKPDIFKRPSWGICFITENKKNQELLQKPKEVLKMIQSNLNRKISINIAQKSETMFIFNV